MSIEINKQAKAIFAAGKALANEIEVAIRDTLISNAMRIERFHERQEELMNVDHQFLFFYALSLVLFFMSSARSWTEVEINSIIDKVSEEFVREMRFRTADQGDLEATSLMISKQFRGVFGNVRSNFSRLGEIGKGKESSDNLIFALILKYLIKVHPASATFFAEGNTPVIVLLQQRFGLISISAYRYFSH
jgi:hypothetical protein